MKSLDDSQLGSWKHAVLSAGGAWHHRRHHSKNGKFSVRDDYTVALLCYMHLCQKRSDKIATEELYNGTSKSKTYCRLRFLSTCAYFKNCKKYALKRQLQISPTEASHTHLQLLNYGTAELKWAKIATLTMSSHILESLIHEHQTLNNVWMLVFEEELT